MEVKECLVRDEVELMRLCYRVLLFTLVHRIEDGWKSTRDSARLRPSRALELRSGGREDGSIPLHYAMLDETLALVAREESERIESVFDDHLAPLIRELSVPSALLLSLHRRFNFRSIPIYLLKEEQKRLQLDLKLILIRAQGPGLPRVPRAPTQFIPPSTPMPAYDHRLGLLYEIECFNRWYRYESGFALESSMLLHTPVASFQARTWLHSRMGID